MTTWVILGTGGHGRSVADAIRACGHELLGFLDDKVPPAELVAGAPVLGPLSLAWQWPQLPHLSTAPDRLVVALGNPSLRHTWQQVLERQAAPVGVVVHPRTWVSPSAELSPGCVVLAGAVVDHDAICGAYSQLGINASMAGGSRLGPLAALAAGEVLSCRESRCAELQLALGAADLSEGVSCHGSAP